VKKLFGAAPLHSGLAGADDVDSRLGADEAKRREGLRSAESQAQADGLGIWAEQPENVSILLPQEYRS
jgi:staphylococcal nuclease domain-containing protein 1